MKEITEAITARQAQIKKLQSDVEALQRAARALAGNATATASRPKAKRKRPKMTAAAKKDLSKKLKAYWAKRKRARR